MVFALIQRVFTVLLGRVLHPDLNRYNQCHIVDKNKMHLLLHWNNSNSVDRQQENVDVIRQ